MVITVDKRAADKLVSFFFNFFFFFDLISFFIDSFFFVRKLRFIRQSIPSRLKSSPGSDFYHVTLFYSFSLFFFKFFFFFFH